MEKIRAKEDDYNTTRWAALFLCACFERREDTARAVLRTSFCVETKKSDVRTQKRFLCRLRGTRARTGTLKTPFFSRDKKEEDFLKKNRGKKDPPQKGLKNEGPKKVLMGAKGEFFLCTSTYENTQKSQICWIDRYRRIKKRKYRNDRQKERPPILYRMV